MNKGKNPNRLIHSNSPYLKQHAYNPVDWYPWCDEALERAKKEDKPLLISIGYSACHWCHVMERESFENELIASWMNDHYICIKVDREERPDVDQVYMEAVHVMGVQGGWPLNVFATPDQKPFYGGTYFRPEEWLNVLQNITRIFNEEHEKLMKSASDIADRVAIPDSLIFSLSDDAKISGIEEIRLVFDKIRTAIDQNNGGIGRAPKFPNPSIWFFLLMHKLIDEDPELDDLINRTLTNMSFGGIYDHLGGGFARYSVDEKWFAPHFEKMLYDNAQLISLYAQAHMVYGEKRYKQVVYETVNFVRRELMAPGGGFYAALDADSEGEEGKYYVWDYREFTDQAGEDGALAASYFNLEEEGNWEKGKNILFVTNTTEQFAESQGLDPSAFNIRISHVKKQLHNARSSRVRPGLDNKVISGWNSLMIKGLVDAYRAFGDPDFLKDAVETAEFIRRKGFRDGRLMRIISSEGDAIEACLDDYALYIDALIALYQVVFDEKYILRAKELTIDCIQNFYDPSEELFYFSGETSKPLFARKKEIFDNVIPSSNSVMAHNLFFLGSVYDDPGFMDMSRVMQGKFGEMIHSEPLHLTNWGKLMLLQGKGLVEIVVAGKDYEQFCEEINREYMPHKILYGVSDAGLLPLTKNKKPINDRTTIYVCKDKTCKLPVHSVKEALNQIQDY